MDFSFVIIILTLSLQFWQISVKIGDLRLIVIGVNVDFIEQIETFRKNKTKIIVFALNKSSIPNYVISDDCIIIGNLHKNLRMLYIF